MVFFILCFDFLNIVLVLSHSSPPYCGYCLVKSHVISLRCLSFAKLAYAIVYLLQYIKFAHFFIYQYNLTSCFTAIFFIFLNYSIFHFFKILIFFTLCLKNKPWINSPINWDLLLFGQTNCNFVLQVVEIETIRFFRWQLSQYFALILHIILLKSLLIINKISIIHAQFQILRAYVGSLQNFIFQLNNLHLLVGFNHGLPNAIELHIEHNWVLGGLTIVFNLVVFVGNLNHIIFLYIRWVICLQWRFEGLQQICSCMNIFSWASLAIKWSSRCKTCLRRALQWQVMCRNEYIINSMTETHYHFNGVVVMFKNTQEIFYDFPASGSNLLYSPVLATSLNLNFYLLVFRPQISILQLQQDNMPASSVYYLHIGHIHSYISWAKFIFFTKPFWIITYLLQALHYLFWHLAYKLHPLQAILQSGAFLEKLLLTLFFKSRKLKKHLLAFSTAKLKYMFISSQIPQSFNEKLGLLIVFVGASREIQHPIFQVYSGFNPIFSIILLLSCPTVSSQLTMIVNGGQLPIIKFTQISAMLNAKYIVLFILIIQLTIGNLKTVIQQIISFGNSP